tara:strand:- start:4300 stop:4656 length:357 start_codon:yes stop_codon:yes gene_type:complete
MTKKPKKLTKPPHKRTDEEAEAVSMMAAVGISQENIAKVIGVDIKTLTKYYREEIDTAWIKANAKVGGAMYNKAIGGDVQAQKYWMGCRAGWKETSVNEISGEEGGPIILWGKNTKSE